MCHSLALLLGFKLREIDVHLVETSGPETAIARQPVVDGLERPGLQPTGPPLRLAPARDEACGLQHLQMPRHRRQADVEGLRDLVHSRLPLASRARIARRVGSASAERVTERVSSII